MRALAVGVIVLGVLTLGMHAQGPVPREPMIQKTTVGSELYKFYCSNCHGLDARGRPATSAMRAPASDLTALSLNNRGMFPRERVRETIIKGTGSHRANNMPVWGTIFRALEPSDAMVEVRIDNLVKYIESLQTNAVGTHSH
jgi:mono/diheme cytochrome c family protein